MHNSYTKQYHYYYLITSIKIRIREIAWDFDQNVFRININTNFAIGI